jgi:alkanesulfonate monooxygenase SsuD/methylene tetrahydromethanopterin reductase-like flavin-dependent oxidoreductase (luciferase family)
VRREFVHQSKGGLECKGTLDKEEVNMQYGLSLPNGGPWSDARTLAELSQLAEYSGWDGVFLEDYIVWQSDQSVPTYDPWVALAAIAIQTKRIRIGTQVTAPARRRPWKLAREAVTLDHLSNGRLILGVGLGDTGESVLPDVSFTHFNEMKDPVERARMLDEALEVLTGLWSGEPFGYEGRYYQVKEVTFLPPPVQSPRIPIWIGGGLPLKGPMRRAARWDGMCPYKHKSHYLMPDDIRALREFVQAQRGSLQGYDIAVGGSGRGADWDEEREYVQSLAEAGITWWTEYIPPDSGDVETVRSLINRGPLFIR